jgi:hypothetical protein
MFRMRTFACFFLALLCFGCAGCAVEKDPIAIAKRRANRERNEKTKKEIDKMWHEGYGFNNPNPDRISKGLPTLDFDGKERK